MKKIERLADLLTAINVGGKSSLEERLIKIVDQLLFERSVFGKNLFQCTLKNKVSVKKERKNLKYHKNDTQNYVYSVCLFIIDDQSCTCHRI